MQYYSTLTHCYSLSKTLRNELIPIGRTLENIKAEEILAHDKRRNENYQLVKPILDEYHKAFIARSLDNVVLSKLSDAVDAYNMRDGINDKRLEKAFDDLRKEISEIFKKMPEYKLLDKKELIEDLVPKMLNNADDIEMVKSFTGFTTYFTGYNKVRLNLYSAEKKSSSVAYRLVDENLPRFLDNIGIYLRLVKNGIDVTEVAKTVGMQEIDSMFDGSAYNHLLTQANIDTYNEVVGKLNSLINEANQHLGEDQKKIPKMKTLYKMLLSDRTKQYQVDSFADDSEVILALSTFTDYLEGFIRGSQMNTFIQSLISCNGQGIYIKNDTSLTSLAIAINENWDFFRSAISEAYDNAYTGKKTGEKREEEKKKELNKVKSYSVEELVRITGKNTIIKLYIDKLKELFCLFMESKRVMDDAISSHDRNRRLSKNTGAVERIKATLDAVKEIEHLIQLLGGTMLEVGRNELVYGEWTMVMDEMRAVDALYNMTRSYLTKKPFSTDKIKLNFDCPTFLNGWDKNKEQQNLGVLFFKDNMYYLGILDSDNRKAISEAPIASSNERYKKMEYKLLPGPNKMLPKVCFAQSNRELFKPSEEIMTIYERGSFKKGEGFNLEDCHKLIEFFKECISLYPDWSTFGFKFSPTSEYEDISGFYREVERQGYKISTREIDKDYIDNLVDHGKMYLFQIYNQTICNDLHFVTSWIYLYNVIVKKQKQELPHTKGGHQNEL